MVKRDSLGRERRPDWAYSQHGGRSSPKFICWTCKVCSRVWPATSRSDRYDTKCRQCGTRNTIKFTGETGSWIQGRERVTRFLYYPTIQMATRYAIFSNKQWMARRRKMQYNHQGFSTANMLDKTQGSVDANGLHHPVREIDSI